VLSTVCGGPVGHGVMLVLVSSATTAPPRVERNFAFLDLCGFTDFTDEHGDDQAAEALHILRACVREAASNHGVRVDKWLGDGAMLVGVESPPLLNAVVEAKWALAEEAPLPMRAGLAVGRVMVFEGDDYVGRVVNLAAKLCDMAEPGQCLAPTSLGSRCPPGLVAHPVGPRLVRGFAQPIDLVAIDTSGDDVGLRRRDLGVALGIAIRARFPR
jgi:adenylate cyclase